MENLKINEQIKFLRRQAGMSQEELAAKLGVTNQAVSKWEASQCCPDIQLLPELARIFGVTTDRLLGYAPEDASGDMLLKLRSLFDAMSLEEAQKKAAETAAAIHLTFLMRCLPDAHKADLERAGAKAERGEWGYSCCSLPLITTAMKGGTVIFARNSGAPVGAQDAVRISACARLFSDPVNLRVFFAIWSLTASDEKKKVTAGEIAEAGGIGESVVKERTEGQLSGLLEAGTEGKVNVWRISGPQMYLPPLLSMMSGI